MRVKIAWILYGVCGIVLLLLHAHIRAADLVPEKDILFNATGATVMQ